MINIQNQVAPLRIKENGALYELLKFMNQLIQSQKQLNNNQIIEIEGRIGAFIPKDQNDIVTFQLLGAIQEQFSLQGMMILNSICQDRTRFESDVPEHQYENTLRYLEQIVKANQKRKFYYERYKKDKTPFPNLKNNFFYQLGENSDIQEIKCTQDDLLFDICFQDSLRISYTVNKKKFDVIKKEQMEDNNKDIMFNRVNFRISAKKETTLQNPDIQNLIKNNIIKTFRFKQRKSFSYQFMEISCTRVLQVDKNANNMGFQELFENVNENINTLDVLNEILINYFGKFFIKKNPSIGSKRREIEIEIKDLKTFIKDDQKIVEMKMRAFMKNIQVLFRVGNELVYVEENIKLKGKLYESEFSKQRQLNPNEQFQFDEANFQEYIQPDIGEYMKKEIQNFALKNLVPDMIGIESEDIH